MLLPRSIVIVLLALSACAGEISERDRVNARIQYDVGVEHLSKGNLSGALHAFLQSEQLDTSFADLHNALGLVYMSLGKYEEAAASFAKTLELKPTWSDVHNNLGTVLLMKGQYDRAIKEFRVALADVLYATPSHAEGNMGYAFFKKGDQIQGIKHIKNATLVNPKFCRGYMWLGEIYQVSGELRDAERYLDRFIERCLLDPNIKATVDAAATSEVYMRLGQVVMATGNTARAKLAFQACVDAGKDTPFFDDCDRGLRLVR